MEIIKKVMYSTKNEAEIIRWLEEIVDKEILRIVDSDDQNKARLHMSKYQYQQQNKKGG